MEGLMHDAKCYNEKIIDEYMSTHYNFFCLCDMSHIFFPLWYRLSNREYVGERQLAPSQLTAIEHDGETSFVY